MMRRNPSSFRDPAGQVYEMDGHIIRTIDISYAEDWKHIKKSGFLDKAVSAGLMPGIKEIPVPIEIARPETCTALEVEHVPFISYPYEWSFPQLKAAALLTLKLQMLALEHGCILKDASAYNIQFLGWRPVFIDILSFERWDGKKPWDAYRQFCQQFLAPLALESWLDLRCGLFSRQWIDGVPLDLACSMLPLRARLSPGLGMHLFLHSKMQQKHADARFSGEKARKVRLSPQKMLDLADSLESTIKSLNPDKKITEWGNYYQDTNYTDTAMLDKAAYVSKIAMEHLSQPDASNALALDIGANDGYFSKLLAPHFATVVAADVDHTATGAHYLRLVNGKQDNVLPLVQDLTSPSPYIGWALRERESFLARTKADLALALALCHHLHFTGGIPFAEIASFFAGILAPEGTLLVEFVPADDSQVRRMLAARDIPLGHYTLENFIAAFADAGLAEIDRHSVSESRRTLLALRKA